MEIGFMKLNVIIRGCIASVNLLRDHLQGQCPKRKT